ncbi:endonuclease Q family protein [bacterium]|nr:endonuclease Q family protein [bacterium]
MKFIADLHVHSSFSRATSKKSDLPGLAGWAVVKGIKVVATGDFTHPGWLTYLKTNLTPAEPGLFKLKENKIPPVFPDVLSQFDPVRFILTSEISCIYKKGGQIRKIHVVLYAPDFESVEKINFKLSTIGNLKADGRPILGLDVKHLMEILLEQCPQGFMIPAHIWTPWFSLFGSKSGFDSIEECFEDLTEHIFALETGLSSDPEMNRRISSLDRFTLVSNSDCHSPSKLGREANLFETDLDFFSIREALKNPYSNGFKGTIEFYPEEGKYHFDGHRKCGICLEPAETIKLNNLCPVCQKPLTVGVMHRVLDLADRDQPVYPEGQTDFFNLIPLTEVFSEILRVGVNTKTVLKEYQRAINLFGPELSILQDIPIEEINHRHSSILAEAIKRLREGTVIKNPGYDGQFGVVRLFSENEI